MNTMIHGFISFTERVESILGRKLATQDEIDYAEKAFIWNRTQFNYISPSRAQEAANVISKGVAA